MQRHPLLQDSLSVHYLVNHRRKQLPFAYPPAVLSPNSPNCPDLRIRQRLQFSPSILAALLVVWLQGLRTASTAMSCS
jgi:hypothetical protein